MNQSQPFLLEKYVFRENIRLQLIFLIYNQTTEKNSYFRRFLRKICNR